MSVITLQTQLKQKTMAKASAPGATPTETKLELNANLTATKVPTNKFDGKKIIETFLYYLVVETPKGNTMINVGEKTYDSITKLTTP